MTEADIHKFFSAVTSNNIPCVREMLENGADPNARAKNGEHILGFTLKSYNRAEIAILLLDYGTDVHQNMRDDQDIPPFRILATPALGQKQVDKLIAEGEFTLKDMAGYRKLTPLMLEVRAGGMIEVVNRLISMKVDVNAEDYRGETALMIAARNDIEVVKTLLNAGANLHALTDQNENALFYAATYGKLEIVKLLLSLGCDPFVESRKGTALHVLQEESRYPDIIQYLETWINQKQLDDAVGHNKPNEDLTLL